MNGQNQKLSDQTLYTVSLLDFFYVKVPLTDEFTSFKIKK